MIRTRDFLMFALTFVFLVAGISATVLAQSWRGNDDQVAAVTHFEPEEDTTPTEVTVVEEAEIPREENISRLRQKIAMGEGDIEAGEPIFTSVDDLLADEPVVTDQTAPTSAMIGHTMDGQPLMSSELWRFVGFGPADQIGVALNGFPIFGSRPDTLALDACGGIDEGFGYRLYLQAGAEIDPSCFAAR